MSNIVAKNKDEDMKELARLMNELKEENALKDKEITIMKKQMEKLTNKLQIQNIGFKTIFKIIYTFIY